jgi:hypothetical protein
VKRTIGMCCGAAAVVAGMVGSAAPAAADVTPLFSRHFVCYDVTNREGNGSVTQWGKECQDNDIFTVRHGQTLCVAVRGSAGHGINFRAYEEGGTGNWLGRESRELVVGSARDCIFPNRLGRTVTVHFKAQSNTWFGVDVYATGYVV